MTKEIKITCKTCSICEIKGNENSQVGICTLMNKMMDIRVVKDCKYYKSKELMDRIEEAKKLLNSNGYAVIRITEKMKTDLKKCSGMMQDDEDMCCHCCNCNICISGYI